MSKAQGADGEAVVNMEWATKKTCIERRTGVVALTLMKKFGRSVPETRRPMMDRVEEVRGQPGGHEYSSQTEMQRVQQSTECAESDWMRESKRMQFKGSSLSGVSHGEKEGRVE